MTTDEGAVAATTAPSAEIVALLRPENTKASLGDILPLLAPPEPTTDLLLRRTASVTTLSEKQMASLVRLPEVYGDVSPAEPRALTPAEVKSLLEERQALADVEKAVKKRKDDHTIIVHNHFDAQIVEGKSEEEVAALGYDIHPTNGFFITPGRSGAPDGRDDEFTREVSTGSPTLDPAMLKSLVESGDLDNKDYLAMTRQVRLVDEGQVMDVLRKKPDLIEVIRKATVPGKRNASIYVRKAK